MAIKNTGLLTKGLRSDFFERLMAVATVFQDWCMRIASTADKETIRWLGSVPQMREWGTGRQAKGLRTESYDVENLKYEATLEVDRDEIDDDQTGQIKIRVGELADRAATHKDYMLGQLLANGSSAGFNSYDGVTFFNTAHVSGASGNQANEIDIECVDPNNPTVAEMRLAVQKGIAAMLGFKDDQGQPLNLDMGGIKCVTPPATYFTAREALNAGIIVNTTNTMQGTAEPVAFPFITDPTEMFLLKVNRTIRPFIFQDRRPLEFNALDQADSEEAFLREKYYYGVVARYRVTYGQWACAVKINFVEA